MTEGLLSAVPTQETFGQPQGGVGDLRPSWLLLQVISHNRRRVLAL